MCRASGYILPEMLSLSSQIFPRRIVGSYVRMLNQNFWNIILHNIVASHQLNK